MYKKNEVGIIYTFSFSKSKVSVFISRPNINIFSHDHHKSTFVQDDPTSAKIYFILRESKMKTDRKQINLPDLYSLPMAA